VGQVLRPFGLYKGGDKEKIKGKKSGTSVVGRGMGRGSRNEKLNQGEEKFRAG